MTNHLLPQIVVYREEKVLEFDLGQCFNRCIHNPLLKNFAALLLATDLEGPVLDLACGEGENGLFLTGLGLPVIHYFEGLLEPPPRAMAQIVCRKPS